MSTMTACCETGCSECVAPCDTCSEYNCKCCPECGGEGEFDPTTAESGAAAYMLRCEECGGTGRKKAVAS